MLTLFRKIKSWFSGKQGREGKKDVSKAKINEKKWEGKPPTLLYRKSLDRMNDDERAFYEYWLKNWRQGKSVELKGNIDYLRPYIEKILSRSKGSQKSHEKLIEELKELQDAYNHNPTFFGRTGTWIADTYILDERYKEAINELRKVRDNCGYNVSKKLWSLMHHIESTPVGKDLLAQHSQLTDYGKRNIDRVNQVLTKLLKDYEEENNINLINKCVEKMIADGNTVQLRLYRATSFRWVRETDLDAYKPAKSEIKNLLEEEGLRVEAENRIREKDDLPKIGEGWVSEAILKDIVKDLLEPHGFLVEYRSSPSWLGRQHLDIFVSELDFAIEYMGKQHYEPVDHFGGKESFQQLKRNDEKKRMKCKKNEIDLIYFKYDKPLEAEYVAKKMEKHVPLEIDEMLDKANRNGKDKKDYLSYRDEKVQSALSTENDPDKPRQSKKERKRQERKAQKLKELRKPGLEGAYIARARLLRQLGRVKEAEEEYWQAIERDINRDMVPAPASIRELAKLYYHTGFTEEALEVLSIYIESSHWTEVKNKKKRKKMKSLKKRMESGDFRRYTNKYDDKPVGDRP